MNRREQMRSWLAGRAERGLTFRELSLETGVPVGTLAFWAWKFREEVRVGEPRPEFVELVAKTREVGGRLEVVLANDRRVLVSDEIDEEQLVRIVRALERC